MWNLNSIVAAFVLASVGFVSNADEREVLEVLVTPYNVTIDSGASKSMSARVVYSDGYEHQTEGVTWHSTNPEVAPISENGVVFGIETGLSLVTATYQGVQSSDHATVKVGESTVQELTIDFPTRNMVAGETKQATANAVFTDGTESDVTTAVKWETVNSSSIISVDDKGLVTAHKDGYGVLKAHADNLSSDGIRIDVSETESEYEWIIPFPNNTTMAVGSQFTPSIKGFHNSGKLIDIEEIEGWIIDDSSIVRASSDNGSIIAVGTGTTTAYPIAVGLQAVEPVVINVE
ncbi:Ig-like domain-containing protein [Vibrio astriarenae]|uniref:Ig-like domain-containing protein n=1 Tax=Vibrio astriarenae TaxID=1481923 RepID=UPI0037355AA5